MSGVLSERVRAGSEAAPWVVEEIKRLEQSLTAEAKDAARYRFLRDGEYPLDTLDVLIAANVHKSKVDAAVDEAMEKANG